MNLPASQSPQEIEAASLSTNVINDLELQFRAMAAAVASSRNVTYLERDRNLESLYKLIDENSEQICDALNADFGCRAHSESQISDIVGSLSSIRYLRRNLKTLIRPRRKRTGVWYLPGSNSVTPQPLGVVGVMSPWNYPVHLMIAPVAAALAAGNRVLAKMSEDTPNTSALIEALVEERFPAETFRIVTGGPDVSVYFSSIKFDHLLFTGSTSIGRKVAMAAAKNLTPVTLELSGKSPAVVTQSYEIQEAAKRITWGKVFNAGQTCVAPDYAFVADDALLEFIRGCRTCYKGFFQNGITDQDYTSVINERQAKRIRRLLADAKEQGAEVLSFEQASSVGNKIPLTLVINPTPSSKIYTEEVFGPVLIVFTYKALTEVIEHINRVEDPLALYIFTKFDAEAKFLARETRAAGVTVNDTLLHYLQNDLPFGGRGSSGFGRYHGAEGFETFSHMQPVFKQRGVAGFTGLKLLYPPYGKLSQLTGYLIRKFP